MIITRDAATGRAVTTHQITRELLDREYVGQERSAVDVAKDFGCTPTAIIYQLRKFGLPIRNPGFYKAKTGCDLTGIRFGKLIVLRRHEKSLGNQRWICLCDCGREYVALIHNLRNGIVRKCRSCLFPGNGYGEITNSAWADIVRGARARQMPLDVSVEECNEQFVRQNRRCALSGQPISFAPTRYAHRTERETTASLDRIDSSLGYLPGNIQWVHKIINIMKGSLPESEFIAMCKLIADHRR